jgi:hypothetical protein
MPEPDPSPLVHLPTAAARTATPPLHGPPTAGPPPHADAACGLNALLRSAIGGGASQPVEQWLSKLLRRGDQAGARPPE